MSPKIWNHLFINAQVMREDTKLHQFFVDNINERWEFEPFIIEIRFVVVANMQK